MNSWFCWNKRQRSGSALWVNRRSHHPRRFVQQVIDRIRLNPDRHSVNFNNISIHFNPCAEHDLFTIYGDSPIGDEVLTHSPAAKPRTRKHLLQPFSCRVCSQKLSRSRNQQAQMSRPALDAVALQAALRLAQSLAGLFRQTPEGR